MVLGEERLLSNEKNFVSSSFDIDIEPVENSPLQNLYFMKKIILLLALCGGISLESIASAPTEITADSTLLKEYVGKFKVASNLFEEVIVTFENGKLMAEAVGQGKTELIPDEKTPDNFEVQGYDGSVLFSRDAARKVIRFKMSVSGQEFEGERVN